MNRARTVTYFRHPSALVETENVGEGTRVWAFAHVLAGAVIGKDCNVCDHVFIENDVVVGDRVTIKCGVQLWDGMRVHDDVFIGPNATFTNDRYPRSKSYERYREEMQCTVIEAGASIGANATILPGVRVGAGAMVGAGAVVTRDVPPGVVVVGNPARPVRSAGRGGTETMPTYGEFRVVTASEGAYLPAGSWVAALRGASALVSDAPEAPGPIELVLGAPPVEVPEGSRWRFEGEDGASALLLTAPPRPGAA